ncbi:hypothetical protein D3C72_1294840 [compost metagenome]
MVVRPGWRQGRRDLQAPRHSQVQQQDALVQLQNNVFSPSQNMLHHAAGKRCGLNPQRPAQGLSKRDAFNGGALQGLNQSASCHFHFW